MKLIKLLELNNLTAFRACYTEKYITENRHELLASACVNVADKVAEYLLSLFRLNNESIDTDIDYHMFVEVY